MSPDKLAVTLRQRNGWEAIDLGFQLARHCAGTLFPAVAICIGILSAALLLLAWLTDSSGDLWLATVMWWCKPIYDRLALHILSHVVFGESITVRAALRALPGVLWNSRLFAALTWRRFNPQRSVELAIDQLEGLPGKAARARRRLISKKVSGQGTGLLFCLANFEWVLAFSAFGLLVLFAPDDSSPISSLWALISDDVVQDTLGYNIVYAIVYGSIMAFVEPFYVAGGFGLYLKRRTDLEAWDVEMQFHRLNAASKTALPAVRQLLLPLLLCLGAYWGLPDPVMAQSQTNESTDTATIPPTRREQAAQQAPAAIAEVLKDPDFGRDETHRRLRLREQAPDEERSNWGLPEWLKDIYRFWGELATWFAEAGRVIGWIILGIIVVVLSVFLLRQLDKLKGRTRRAAPPGMLAGLNIHPDSLPRDIGAAVRQLIAARKKREALALLYRAALSRLAHDECIPFEPGDTEGDCLSRVIRADSRAQDYFARLTQRWQDLAYARLPIASADAELLCSEWLLVFGETS